MGNHWRDFTYIDDVVENLVRLLNKKFSTHVILNICSNKPILIRELIEYLSKKQIFQKIRNIKKINMKFSKHMEKIIS